MNINRVLVADDQELLLHLISEFLSPMNCEIIMAGKGKDAIQKATDNEIDIIIMDIVLPDIDGPEVVRRIRKNKPNTDIPVLFISGIVDSSAEAPEVVVDGIKYPAIGKPFTREHIMAGIKKAQALFTNGS